MDESEKPSDDVADTRYTSAGITGYVTPLPEDRGGKLRDG
jgi:hypothetical protein